MFRPIMRRTWFVPETAGPVSGFARASGAGFGRLAPFSASVGLGGPGRGPRPIVPVRGIFRRRWRRYRLSYSAAGPAIVSPIGRGAAGSRGILALFGAGDLAGTAAGAGTGEAPAGGVPPIVLGGPGRGPWPIVPVRGIFRRRWRRYRLSYSSLRNQGLAATGTASHGGASGRLAALQGIAVWPGGRVTGLAHAEAALPGAVSSPARARARAVGALIGVFGGLLPTGLAARGISWAAVALVGRRSLAARTVSAGVARLRVAGVTRAPGRAAGRGGAAAAIGGMLRLAARAAGARSVGSLAGTLGEIAIAALRGRGAVVGRLAGIGSVMLPGGRAAAGSSGHARAVGSISAAVRAASAAVGHAIGVPGVAIVGTMHAAAGLIGRAAWKAAGTIDARTGGNGRGWAASAGGVLAGWLRAIGTSIGGLYGHQDPLIFDPAFWMLPPTTGLVMTALRRRRDVGPYS